MTPSQQLDETWERTFQALPAWRALSPMLHRNLASHGDVPRWFGHLTQLPSLTPTQAQIGPTITIGSDTDADRASRDALRIALLGLTPWRKGPFSLFGIDIDTEWRSDWKWQRVAPHISPLNGRRVLDVGCGNGYYGWRMCAAGAERVVGIDPTLIYLMQFLALHRYVAPVLPRLDNVVLPARLEDVPAAGAFDTVFSMGVLYHRKDPTAHLRALREQLRPGGELVLETLIVREPSSGVLIPPERYAGMRNVWQIPGPQTLERWLDDAGFHNVRCVDTTATTVAEQRTTPWMPLQSLADALDPADKLTTVEGLPAPVRSIVIAEI